MKTYAVRASKEEKSLHYILFMNDKTDDDVILYRMADLIEISNKTEFEEIASWRVYLTPTQMAEFAPSVQSQDPHWFFPKKITEEKWNEIVECNLITDFDSVTDDETEMAFTRTVIV